MMLMHCVIFRARNGHVVVLIGRTCVSWGSVSCQYSLIALKNTRQWLRICLEGSDGASCMQVLGRDVLGVR